MQSTSMTIINSLKEFIHKDYIHENEPLSKHTYTKTGGRAEILIRPKSILEVEQVCQYAYKNKIPLTLLGNGSNVIISDKGIRGITIIMIHIQEIKVVGNQMVVGSGASLIEVAKIAQSFELSGLEFACGIPGTVGGALFMNAGAYGGEISEVLIDAKVFTESGQFLILRQNDFQFGYRSSVFAKEKLTIVEATFQLEKLDPIKIKEKMDHLTFLRESKQPLEYPSCGSVFKRPPHHFTGQLIQECGLQGTRIGGAEVSTKHAGFIVNVDHATSTDYLQLILHIQETVKKKFNVDLQTEVKIIGER